MTVPHAVIIAGGKGERLGGVRKAGLRIGGVAMIDRVRTALGEVAKPVLVATGPGASWLAEGIPDLHAPVGGPLAGLAAAVAALRSRGIAHGLLVSVAVDTPFLPRDFLSVLDAALGDAPAAYAAWGDQFYPPNALWRIEALQALPEQVLANVAPPSLKALLHDVGARQVNWQGRTATDPFRNLNTLDDLVALGRMARDEGVSPLIHKPGN